MKVLLSGFNLDIETINELKGFIQRVVDLLNESSFSMLDEQTRRKHLHSLYGEALTLLERDNLTPETLSAAYARISRNPKPVNELREIARQEVDKARKSNQNIIFGLGHSSVAEHAAFNFDVLGVSRYAVEMLEHFRLASYTEKSQRYILFKDDFVIPPELQKTGLEEDYVRTIREQNQVYYTLYEQLRPYFFKKHADLAKDSKNDRLLEGLAKEDARYIISLATQTQLGMTVNARTLENIISKCNSHPLSEIREYGRLLYECTKSYTPSIVKYVKPTPYLTEKNKDITAFIQNNVTKKYTFEGEEEPTVRLVDYPADADEQILAIILFKQVNIKLEQAKKLVTSLNPGQKLDFFKKIFNNMNPWDSVLREFEFIYFTFELIVSASNYGQLKRHRMANIITQNYDPSLGVTIPNSIIETKQDHTFRVMIEKTEFFYEKLHKQNPLISPYILTNAHRRRVLFKINLRELYHFSRLREDQHAQWDIRNIAFQMVKLVKNRLPLSAVLLSGKDVFDSTYKQFMKS